MFLFTYFSPSSQSPMMTLSFVIIVIIAALASPHASPRLAIRFASLATRSIREISLHRAPCASLTHFKASKTALSLV